MPLSKQYALDQIEHALGRRVDRRVDAYQLINDAGHHFVGLRDWEFLKRPPVGLDLVADQSWIALPADFGQLLAVEPAETPTFGFEMVSAAELEEWRANNLAVGFSYRGSVGYHVIDPTGGDNLRTVARLEIAPTPSESTGEGTELETPLRLVYRAGWVEATEGGFEWLESVPDSARGLYLALLRAFARGWERSDEAYLSMRLAEIVGTDRRPGPLFRAAARADIGASRAVGRLRNGAAEGPRFVSRTYDPVPPPSGP